MVRLGSPRLLACTLLPFLLSLRTAEAQSDPPARVIRLNYFSGNVSLDPAGTDEWTPAGINRPLSIGDYLFADREAVAELHTDIAVVRLDHDTNMGVVNLTDNLVQLTLTQGDLFLRVHDLNPNEAFEVDTPNAAVSLLRPGVYLLHVDPATNTTFVIARSGEAEIMGGGQAFTLNPGSSAALSGTDQLGYNIAGAPPPDAFETWCSSRDAAFAHRPSAGYLPATLIGGEDLEDNGAWQEDAQYGHVWYPRAVPAGWAPYHNGHWAWIEPWGWTWIDDAPWGFAPFHYGRWVHEDNRWGWCPGPVAAVRVGHPRPVYAPALVAWFGGAHWGASLSMGGGAPPIGWVPLSYGEVYTPSYHVSQRYFTNVNVNNTKIVNNVNITNVYKTIYVSKTVYKQTFINTRVANAVTAMPQGSFASGRPVGQSARFLNAQQAGRPEMAQAWVAAPQAAPTREAIALNAGRPAAHPPTQYIARPVIARSTPPPPAATFAVREKFLQQQSGQVFDAAAMRQAIPSRQAGPPSQGVLPNRGIAANPGVPSRQGEALPVMAGPQEHVPRPEAVVNQQPLREHEQPHSQATERTHGQAAGPAGSSNPQAGHEHDRPRTMEQPRVQGPPAAVTNQQPEREHEHPHPAEHLRPAEQIHPQPPANQQPEREHEHPHPAEHLRPAEQVHPQPTAQPPANPQAQHERQEPANRSNSEQKRKDTPK